MAEQQQQGSSSKGLAIASLVLGIVGLVFMFFLPIVGIIAGVVGLVLGIIARKKMRSGMATAGIVLSIIALALCIIALIACAACLSALPWAAAQSTIG